MTKPRVLQVEDDEAVYSIVKAVNNKLGIADLEQAISLEQGLRAVKGEEPGFSGAPYHSYILDYFLLGRDGDPSLPIAEEIVKLHPEARIYVLSGTVGPAVDGYKSLQEYDAMDISFVQKPCDVSTVKAMLEGGAAGKEY
jgi:hypothetical protein